MPRRVAVPRLNAQRFFLTYAKAEGLSKEDLLYFLPTVAPQFSWCEVAKETHRDGTPHYHAIVVHDSRVQVRTDAFDRRGYHPNIAVIRNGYKQLQNRRDYIRKEDEHPLATDQTPEYTQEAERHTWGTILKTATTKEEFLAGIQEHFPREFCLNWDRLNTFANEHYNAPSDYFSPWPENNWNVPPEIDDWMADVFRQVCSHLLPHGGLRCDGRNKYKDASAHVVLARQIFGVRCSVTVLITY